MKKIIILAYDFPPYVSIGGLRPYSWYKNFKKFGLYPIVITRQWENKNRNHLDYLESSKSKITIVEDSEYGKILRTPFKANIANWLMLKYGENKFSFFRKSIMLFYEYFQFLIPVGNKKNIYLEAKKYLEENKVDYIIATGEPFVLFHYAQKLSLKFDIPWAGDYRDPWALNTINMVSPFLKPWYTYHEKKILKSMNLILTVSEFIGNNLEKYNVNKVPVVIITNGFDEDLINDSDYIKQNKEVLTIAYAGTIYPYHPYNSFLEVLKECKEQYSSFNFQLIFYGINKPDEILKSVRENYKCIEENIKFRSRLPNKVLLKNLSKANALLLFNEYSFMGTKIYDYLAVKRFIIHCFNKDEEAMILKKKHFPMNDDNNFSNKLQEKIIEYTSSGTSINDKNQLKKILIDLSCKLQKEKTIDIKSRNINFFSRKGQSKKLAKTILDNITNY